MTRGSNLSRILLTQSTQCASLWSCSFEKHTRYGVNGAELSTRCQCVTHVVSKRGVADDRSRVSLVYLLTTYRTCTRRHGWDCWYGVVRFRRLNEQSSFLGSVREARRPIDDPIQRLSEPRVRLLAGRCSLRTRVLRCGFPTTSLSADEYRYQGINV